jgi:hypothetical protein
MREQAPTGDRGRNLGGIHGAPLPTRLQRHGIGNYLRNEPLACDLTVHKGEAVAECRYGNTRDPR